MESKRYSSYANVMSTLAVFLALAGGSVAVSARSADQIDSADIDNNSLRSADLKNRKAVKGKDVVDETLGSADLEDGSLTGADVSDDGLSGADLSEPTLAEVPQAASAANADTVDGKSASELQTSSAFAQRTTSLDLTTLEQDVVKTTIATTGTRVIALATLAIEGSAANDVAYCRLRIAGVDSPEYAQQPADSGAHESSIAFMFARDLGPGTHEVAAHCSESGSITVTAGALSLLAVES